MWQYHRPSLRISFAEGVRLLREAGYDAKDDEDLDTEKVGLLLSPQLMNWPPSSDSSLCVCGHEQEKALGRIVKEKYHTDFYIMDQYPLSVRRSLTHIGGRAGWILVSLAL